MPSPFEDEAHIVIVLPRSAEIPVATFDVAEQCVTTEQVPDEIPCELLETAVQ